jgi:hypothetical protein
MLRADASNALQVLQLVGHYSLHFDAKIGGTNTGVESATERI